MVRSDNTTSDMSGVMISGLKVGCTILTVITSYTVLACNKIDLFMITFSMCPVTLDLFGRTGLPEEFVPTTLTFKSMAFAVASTNSPRVRG